MASRELYDLRQKAQQTIDDFLTVGGMGLASQIAAGLSLGLKGKRRVIVFDGDGAAPVQISMTLSFTETEIMTKETIAQGY